MPTCRGQLSTDPWFEENRRYNCQTPKKPSEDVYDVRVGCDHGCRVCGDQIPGEGEDAEFLLFGFIGVDLDGYRRLFAHPRLESRGATGFNVSVRSPSLTRAVRVPPVWAGLLAPCHNDKRAVDIASIPICRCRAEACDPTTGCPWHQGNKETCNVYLGILWPLRGNNQVYCTGFEFPIFDHDDINGGSVGVDERQVAIDPNAPEGWGAYEGPIRVILRSERPALDQAAFVRTGQKSCTSNLGVLCWGHIEQTPSCTTHRCEDGLFSPSDCPNCTHYNGCKPSSAGVGNWIEFQALQVTSLSARFADDKPLIDRPQVRAKNAALAWLDADFRNEKPRTFLQYLNSERVGPGNAGRNKNANNMLDLFRSQYGGPGFSLAAAPAVMKLPGTYLRNSQRPVDHVEYVLRAARFDVSFVPHFIKVREFDRMMMPVVKGHLRMTMGVRIADEKGLVETEFAWRDRTIRIVNDEDRWFPRVEGGDRLIYVDEEGGRLFYPPPFVEVEFDLGPFSDPPWHNLLGNRRTVFSYCDYLFSIMEVYLGRTLYVPAFKTNQHHETSFNVWRGGMSVGWGFDPRRNTH